MFQGRYLGKLYFIGIYWLIFSLDLISIFVFILFFYFYKSINKKIIHEQAHLAEIVANSTDAIIGKTLDGFITSWNKAAEKLFGYSEKEAIGKSIMELLIPDNLQFEENEILHNLKTSKEVLNFESKRRHKDGHLIDVSLNISPIIDETGKIIGASKIVRDITDRLSAKRALEYLNASIEK